MIFSEKAYSELLDRIFTLTPSVQNAGFTGGAYKPGLDGMKRIDAALGHPWQSYTTIHVAGTNGKGSVASMLASALAAGCAGSTAAGCAGGMAAGCAGSMAAAGNPRLPGLSPNSLPGIGDFPAGARTGLYTSPHLTDFRERMKVVTDDGWYMPSKEEVWEFFQSCDTSGLSFFEMTTALAFWWFRRQKVDVAVIETGLGGRLDSTNVITPALSVITSIGLDHCALLGNTRAEIAAEKAGIFKPGVPALVASEDDETAPVFRRIAEETGAPLYFADAVPAFPCEDEILAGMDLQGPCQKQNLHTVLAALQLISPVGANEGTSGCPPGGTSPNISRSSGEGISGCPPGGTSPKILRSAWRSSRIAEEERSSRIAAAIQKTAKRTGLRGRWERLCEKPEVICDIAHNPPALELNFARLRATGRPLTIVYGIMADKDLAGIAPLMPEARYILVAPDIPRAMPVRELRDRLSALRPDLFLQTAPSVAEGIGLALSGTSAASHAENHPIPGMSEHSDPLIYIGGSTFVVTAAIDYFNDSQP